MCINKTNNAFTRVARFAIVAAATLSLSAPELMADRNRGSVRSSNKNINRNVNQNTNVNRNTNINQNTNVNRNVNVNQNVNRNTNVNVNRDIDVHRDVDIDVDVDHDHDHDHFWGGYAAGVATAAVVGAIIPDPPRNSTTVVVANSSYMVADGVYYVQTSGGYKVVNPPVGATVTVLPTGATQTVINGKAVFQINGVTYMPAMQNGATVYTVVQL